jgi:hypothetical protein
LFISENGGFEVIGKLAMQLKSNGNILGSSLFYRLFE